MPRWAWILALVGVGGTALYLRHRTRPLGDARTTARSIIANPAVFGMGAGVANGMLAMARNKPVSLTANLVTAAVIGISEGVLVEDRKQAVNTAMQSALGAASGMAVFTRFDPHRRALVERKAAPAPA